MGIRRRALKSTVVWAAVLGTVAGSSALLAGPGGASAAQAGAGHSLVVNLAGGRDLNPYKALGTSIDSFDAVQGMTHLVKNGITDTAGDIPGTRPAPGFDSDLFTTEQAMSPNNIQHLETSGLKPLSYRLVTELRLEDWHWSPTGTWSQGNQNGYWTSTATTKSAPITESYGYDIAHGGDSLPGGENAYISRLDDGNTTSFWKSDPYLDTHYTHDPNTDHQQWAIVDLGKYVPINTIRIQWANPYAVSYQLQMWDADPGVTDRNPFDSPGRGEWVDFGGGDITGGAGGDVTTTVGSTRAEFVRVLMGTSSHTCDGPSSDIRDCLGYAIREMYVGDTTNGTFVDDVHHGNETVQSTTYVSSNDPAEDASSVRQFDQPGIDEVYNSGANQGLPVMVPVPVLYSTPENAVALIKYLRSKGRKIGSVEIGEEADGEYVSPEDYAALYVEWANALHAYDPSLVIGGPSLQDSTARFFNDTDKTAVDYGTRFIAYLKSHHALQDLKFYSFEQYPYFNSSSFADDYKFLLQEPARTAAVLAQLHKTIPASIPLMVTEQSTFGERPVFGLWQADYIGAMFSNGLSADFNYQAFPTHLFEGGFEGGIAANLGMADKDGQWTANTATYYASVMLGKKWFEPVNAEQSIHQVAVPAILDAKGNQLVTAYSIKRPDGTWALMVINKSETGSYQLPVQFGAGTDGFRGTVSYDTWGQDQYVWLTDRDQGHATTNTGVKHSTVAATAGTAYNFPAFSITVISGHRS